MESCGNPRFASSDESRYACVNESLRAASVQLSRKPRHDVYIRDTYSILVILSSFNDVISLRVRTATIAFATRPRCRGSFALKNGTTTFAFPRLFAWPLVIQVPRCLLEQSNLEIWSVNLSGMYPSLRLNAATRRFKRDKQARKLRALNYFKLR